MDAARTDRSLGPGSARITGPGMAGTADLGERSDQVKGSGRDEVTFGKTWSDRGAGSIHDPVDQS